MPDDPLFCVFDGPAANIQLGVQREVHLVMAGAKVRHVSGDDNAANAARRLSEPAYRGAFVARYDRLRPAPPSDLIALLATLAPERRPGLVVDLGSGTGISAIAWADSAERVIGIEQNPEMLGAARRAPNVEYLHAPAQKTGLSDGSVDIVTCAQSFHWMEHRSTIAEIARILRPEGLFAAYDYDWPPLVHWEVDEAFLAVLARSGIDPNRPEKACHINRLRTSRRFRSVGEAFAHTRESVDAGRLEELPLVFGPVARRLQEGVPQEELGLDHFRRVIERRIGTRDATLWWSYRIRYAVK